MSAPYEIPVGPCDVYLAPVGETMPDVDEAPAGNWALLGTGGKNNTSEDGVRFKGDQTLEQHFVDGLSAPIKVSRSQEQLGFEVTIFDTDPAELTKFFSDTAPTSVVAGSGTPGYDHFEMYRGLTVKEFAVLVRGAGLSPQNDGTASWNFQIEIYRAYNAGAFTPVWSKSSKPGVTWDMMALYSSSDSGIARYVSQDATAV